MERKIKFISFNQANLAEWEDTGQLHEASLVRLAVASKGTDDKLASTEVNNDDLRLSSSNGKVHPTVQVGDENGGKVNILQDDENRQLEAVVAQVLLNPFLLNKSLIYLLTMLNVLRIY